MKQRRELNKSDRVAVGKGGPRGTIYSFGVSGAQVILDKTGEYVRVKYESLAPLRKKPKAPAPTARAREFHVWRAGPHEYWEASPLSCVIPQGSEYVRCREVLPGEAVVTRESLAKALSEVTKEYVAKKAEQGYSHRELGMYTLDNDFLFPMFRALGLDAKEKSE